jgi:guanylate kinase
MLVISSPSGAGKTSLSRRLLADHAGLTLSISCTTRARRAGETDGVEYHFLTQDRFDAMRREDAFLEFALVHEHSYGTPRAPVMALLAQGQDVLFDVDWQGAQAIERAAPEDVVRVFILPPSLEELRRRLERRAQDAQDIIDRRVAGARGEISHWTEYDYVILNDDFERAYAELVHIYRAERIKRARNPWLDGLVRGMLGAED